MGALTAEQIAKLKADTLYACGPFLEDMAYLRKLLPAEQHSPADIRRLSGILRRLLVERAIPIIAAPRVGRIRIPEPDNKPIYRAAEREELEFFLSGGATLYGATFRALAVWSINPARLRPLVPIEGQIDPGAVVQVPADNFLNQKVLCLQRQWASRRDAIKYIANVASGVHAGEPDSDAERLVRRIRRCVTILPERKDGNISANIQVNMDAVAGADPPVVYNEHAFDPVLVEVLTAAHLLCESSDVKGLEEVVARELGLSPKPSA